MSETLVYENDDIGLRFEIDARFAPGARLETPAGLPGNVRSAYLAAHGSTGGQAVLSISLVEVGSETSPQELAEQLVIHNRFAALTASRQGWTIHRPWEPTTVGGFLAMRNDYVAPRSALDADGPLGADAAVAQHGSAPGHVQGYVVYVGRRTFQIMLGVDPPGDLDANRRVMDQAMGSVEFFDPIDE